MTAFLIPQCYASVIINHTIVDSDNDCFQLITYVHKDEDSIPTEDFYAFQMRVHAKKCSDHIYCEISVYSPEGLFDKWEPTAGKKGGSFGFSYGETISFSVTCPEAYIDVYGVNTHEISWEFSGCTTASDVDFACGIYTNEGATPHWTIEVYVFDYTIIAGIWIKLWEDTLTWSSDDPQLSISTTVGGTTNPVPGTYTYSYGESVTVTATADIQYVVYFWVLDGTKHFVNPITVTMNIDHTLKAYFRYIGSGPGGDCPFLSVWNGSDYVDYGVINIHDVENDVIREVPVQAEDVGVAGYKVKFRLREGWEGLNYSHSLIDQVKLYAVNSEGNRLLCPLIKAEHSDQGKVLLKLLFSDDYRTDTYLMDTIDLTFKVPYPAETIENFTFTIEGHNPLKK